MVLFIYFFLHVSPYDCTKDKKSISFGFAVICFFYFKTVGKGFCQKLGLGKGHKKLD